MKTFPEIKHYVFEKPDYQVSRHQTDRAWYGLLACLLLIAICIAWQPKHTAIAPPETKQQPIAWYARKPHADIATRAEQGDRDAQFAMGRYFMNNNQWRKAIYWYQLAAEQGHWKAMNNLGIIYLDGKGIAPDPQKACTLFEAAYQRSNEANIADNIALCQDAQRQFQKAFYYRQIAARGGVVQAQRNLGQMYAAGEGTEANETLAIYWLRQAALQGDVLAITLLGQAYHQSPLFASAADRDLAAYVLLDYVQTHHQKADQAELQKIQLNVYIPYLERELKNTPMRWQIAQHWAQETRQMPVAKLLAAIDQRVPYTAPEEIVKPSPIR